MLYPLFFVMKKAEVLIDALSFIRQFKGAVFVVKLGGEVLVDEEVVSTVSEDLAFLEFVGIKSVVVHGGGKRISEAMEGEGRNLFLLGGFVSLMRILYGLLARF